MFLEIYSINTQFSVLTMGVKFLGNKRGVKCVLRVVYLVLFCVQYYLRMDILPSSFDSIDMKDLSFLTLILILSRFIDS